MKNIVHAQYSAENLVDGNYDNFAGTNNVEDGIWIRVKLPEVALIQQIKIHNRKGCCQERIIGLSVFIKMQEVVVTSCGTITSIENIYTFDCAGRGDVVELSNDGHGNVYIAEIEVFRIIAAPGYDIIATYELINLILI